MDSDTPLCRKRNSAQDESGAINGRHYYPYS